MASNKARRFVATDELWERFRLAVEEDPRPELDRSKALREFVRWYVSEPGAQPPTRPRDA